MKTKATKMLALGVIIGLCAVAIIGAAYAAFAGTASTYNENNSASAAKMTLTPGETGSADWTGIAVNAKEKFSTYTYTDGTDTLTAYYAVGTLDTTSLTGKTILPVLGEKKFSLANDTGAAISTVTLGITQNKLVGADGYVYVVKVGDNYQVLDATGDISAKTFNITIDTDAVAADNQPLANGSAYEITVSLYIAYTANCWIPDNGIGAVSTNAESHSGYSQAAMQVGPAALSGLSFALTVTDTTTP